MNADTVTVTAVPPKIDTRTDVADWRPEDADFWQRTGKRIAYRNLAISVPALLCGFAVWGMWGIITVQMLNLGFPFTQAELFTLTAIAGIAGATMRIPGFVLHPPRRRPQHDLSHHRDAARAGDRHRHRAAAQGLAACGRSS
jgi:NNP family nitrate/nitrite transporter-like MFS transporter